MKQLLSYIVLLPIKLYQWVISPLFPATCRHNPTCSVYTVEAVKEWGPFKGIWLGMKRLAKCHPWGTSGHDPVPRRCNQENCNNKHKKTQSYA